MKAELKAKGLQLQAHERVQVSPPARHWEYLGEDSGWKKLDPEKCLKAEHYGETDYTHIVQVSPPNFIWKCGVPDALRCTGHLSATMATRGRVWGLPKSRVYRMGGQTESG
jgi:hypothetical protein